MLQKVILFFCKFKDRFFFAVFKEKKYEYFKELTKTFMFGCDLVLQNWMMITGQQPLFIPDGGGACPRD